MKEREGTVGLHIDELIDLAYKIAREEFKDQIFSFSSIWSKVWKSAENFSKEKVDSWIGLFYTQLSTDPRFTIFGFNKWKLREYMTQAEIKKIEKTVFADESIFEEEYEAYLSSVAEKKEVEIIPDTLDDEPAKVDGDDDEEDSSEKEETEAEGSKDELFEEEE